MDTESQSIQAERQKALDAEFDALARRAGVDRDSTDYVWGFNDGMRTAIQLLREMGYETIADELRDH